jgi:hypothetical protein
MKIYKKQANIRKNREKNMTIIGKKKEYQTKNMRKVRKIPGTLKSNPGNTKKNP